MSFNFDNMYPYNKIEEVTVDGQKMIKFPKTYVKSDIAPEGSAYAGKRVWMISEFPLEGFHVHPAFMHDGQELDYFLLGKYEASKDANNKAQSLAGKTPWVSITTPNAITACQSRNTGASGSEQYGWHIENIFEYQFVSLLMLIELGAPDVQALIGSGNINGSAVVSTGTSNAVWRGLHDHWADAWEIVDGLKTGANSQVLIWDNQGTETYIDTGVVVQDKGFSNKKGLNYDLGDLFIPADDGSGSTFSGSTSDGVWVAANCVCYLGGSWSGGARVGAFTFDVANAASGSNTSIGFRLAKYDI